jgi:hypothetical protein
MVDAAPGNRSLLLLNFRPEYHAQWMQRSYYQQLPLLPLGPDDDRVVALVVLVAMFVIPALARRVFPALR